MKSSRYFIIAAISASMLVSCTKLADDSTSEGNEVSKERVITIGFAETRTALNGLHSTFEENDPIELSDGQNSETVYVKISNSGVATITIPSTLSGVIYAVYPASAADGYGGYIVSASQTGEFKDADICTSKIPESCRSAVFTTQVSILRFYVDESIGVRSIEISGSHVATGSDKITVSPLGNNTTLGASLDDRICYVAVNPDTYSNLTFSSITSTQDDYDDSTVERTMSSVKLEESTIYNAFIPYYIGIDLDDDGTIDQKWGYCNIGAFLPEEVGLYFGWGEVEGHSLIPNWKNKKDNNSVYKEVFESEFMCYDGEENLSSAYDAASQIWMSDWRMPTVEDFISLTDFDEEESICSAAYVIENACLIIEGICFPFSGYGYQKDLHEYDPTPNRNFSCNYWSSSYSIEDSSPWNLTFDDDGLCLYSYLMEKDWGLPIRPIWGEASEPDEPDTDITGSLDPLDPIGKSVL